jgi:hypothetical protein
VGSSVLVCFASSYPRFVSISFSLLLAIAWQTFMLTESGARLIKKIDTLFIMKEAQA